MPYPLSWCPPSSRDFVLFMRTHGTLLPVRLRFRWECWDMLLWRRLGCGVFCLPAAMGRSVGRQGLTRGQLGSHSRIKKLRRSMLRSSCDCQCRRDMAWDGNSNEDGINIIATLELQLAELHQIPVQFVIRYFSTIQIQLKRAEL